MSSTESPTRPEHGRDRERDQDPVGDGRRRRPDEVGGDGLLSWLTIRPAAAKKTIRKISATDDPKVVEPMTPSAR